jgi:hypothetical protein
MKILNEYEKNITYWVSEKDRGQSEAINKGLKQCSGTIFNWLNSDDFLEPKALYHIAIAFINNISALAVSGKERAIYSNKDEIKINNGTNIKSSLEETLFFGYIDQPVTFFKKLCFDKIGPLNEEFHYTMDSEWWCRYLCEYGLDKIVNIKPILANFRHHNISKSKFGDLANPKFQKDRNTIHLSILKSLNSPSWLFDHYERKPRINIYDSEWEFNFINDSSLLDLFAQSMVQDLKNNGQIIKAIKPKLYSLRKRIKSRIFRIKYNNKS